jgi:hypothetical protein
MRLGIILWGFICSWTLVHSFSFYQSNSLDTAVLLGTGFMVSLYLFIAKTVEYIKEDHPMSINVSVNSNKKTKKKETEE